MPFSAGPTEKVAALKGFGRYEVPGVLDVGAGSGTWRRLALQHKVPVAELPWVAIEAYRPYVQRFKLQELYDDVLVSCLTKVVYKKRFNGWLVIFGDVLEHLHRNQALETLLCVGNIGCTILVHMPFHPSTTALQEVPEVPWENHRYVWAWQDWLQTLRNHRFQTQIIKIPEQLDTTATPQTPNKGLVRLKMRARIVAQEAFRPRRRRK